MAEIRLTEGSIRFQKEWLTADVIKARIKEKMDAGDMKFADLAAALEELNQAMEKARRIEVQIVLTKEDYDKLQKRGGDDDNESVRKAILAFIAGAEKSPPTMEMEAPEPSPGQTKEKGKKPEPSPGQTKEKGKKPEPAEPGLPEMAATIPCSKCKNPVNVPSSERPLELECEFCGTSIVLEEEPSGEEEKEKEISEAGEKDREPLKNVRHQDHFIG
jgi:hypothetical protein